MDLITLVPLYVFKDFCITCILGRWMQCLPSNQRRALFTDQRNAQKKKKKKKERKKKRNAKADMFTVTLKH